MLRIVTYSEIDRVEWNRLVQTSATGTWFQSPEAYDFFASQPALFKPFAYGLINDQLPMTNYKSQLRAVCVGYVTVEKSAIKQFFTRRAIIVGGPALADDATDEEVRTLMEAVREQPILNNVLRTATGSPIGQSSSPVKGRTSDSPIYIECRNFNDYSRWKSAFEKAGFEYKKHLNFHVDCSEKEAMWDRLSENRKRQIRKGERLSVIGDGLREEDIIEWYGILEKLYRTKVKTPLWPVEFFLEAYRQGVGKFLLVKHNGKVIGGTMITSDKMSAAEPLNDTAKLPNAACGTVYEWFECGMNVEYKEQYPSVMATWAGMKYAAEHGCARYDMMGAGEPDVPYGVRDFKSEFGGELVEHGRFLYVCKSWLYGLGTMGIKLLRNQLL